MCLFATRGQLRCEEDVFLLALPKMSSKNQEPSNNDKQMVDHLLRCMEMVKLRHDGQYIENIASTCENQLGWDRPKTLAMLRKAVELEAVQEVTRHGKTSYRCIQPAKNVAIIEDNTEVNSPTVSVVEDQSSQSNRDLLAKN